MATLLVIVAGAVIAGHLSSHKGNNDTSNNGIVYDNRTNPEVLDGILKHL